MKTEKLICQNCGANLEIKENVAFCSYCGAKLTIDDGKRETTFRIVDEAKLKELESLQKKEELERSHTEKKEKSVLKTKLILLAIWIVIVGVLWILSNCTKDNAGFSSYQMLLIPVIIFGVVIIIKEINKFFKNN